MQINAMKNETNQPSLKTLKREYRIAREREQEAYGRYQTSLQSHRAIHEQWQILREARAIAQSKLDEARG